MGGLHAVTQGLSREGGLEQGPGQRQGHGQVGARAGARVLLFLSTERVPPAQSLRPAVGLLAPFPSISTSVSVLAPSLSLGAGGWRRRRHRVGPVPLTPSARVQTEAGKDAAGICERPLRRLAAAESLMTFYF